MKKILPKTMLLFIISMLSFMSAWSQIMPTEQYFAEVYPSNPSATDSIYVAYIYVSNDGCPDYFLAKDSVVVNKIYVSKKRLPDLGMMCTQVISKFKTILNLGTVSENTEIYFDGTLIKTIYASCTMDRMGVVTGKSINFSILKDNSTGDLFEIRDKLLPTGTTVKFKGTKIQCITTPCYNIVECYTVVETSACPLDKDGIVVAGIDGCSGKMFIEDTRVMTAFPQRYVISPLSTNLKAGDRVKFSGYKTAIDSSAVNLCFTVGIATCYELIDITNCVKDKKGVVVKCDGQLLIQEYSPISSVRQLFTIKIDDNNTIPNVNPASANLYNSTRIGVKEGDEVVFGGYYVRNDSNTTNSCRIIGIATCYELRNIPPVGCIMNKKGIVVPGIDGCTGQLFLKEMTKELVAYTRLYKIADTSTLKIGDYVRFGSYDIAKDSLTILCPVVGMVACYSKITTPETYSLTGKAMAGNELMKSGSALLFNKNYRKALISYPITDGSFVFAGLPQAEYTVYVIPDINLYKNYLPTFYINKIFFKTADYITLNDNIEYLTVELKNYKMPVGTGKIYGNIFFETIALKDTVMAENGMRKINAEVAANIAVNIPVLLLNSDNAAVAWTMTDAYGNYAFENIALDNYKVVSETAAAIAEFPVSLTSANTTVNADLMLKRELESTDIPDRKINLLTIYPNPVVDNLTVELIKNSDITIFNTTGQLLMQKQLNSGTNVLNLNTLSKGLFFVKIGDKTIKLIKD
ncbi:MAG: T9SS type A sorting domain-containing protein [Paludibacter sp.]|nr:T9SS type A sorting domain-containing protein [Paludibacter sp.]